VKDEIFFLQNEIGDLRIDIALIEQEKKAAFLEYKELFEEETRLQKLLLKKKKQLKKMESEVQFVS
jgi:predicted  nucleic acid-binding Zn-ribbon protein